MGLISKMSTRMVPALSCRAATGQATFRHSSSLVQSPVVAFRTLYTPSPPSAGGASVMMSNHFQRSTQSQPSWNGLSFEFKRGIVYKKEPRATLPGYILPKQSRKTSFLTKKLKMKHLRLRRGKTGQRARQPAYGRDDRVLSKMNI